MRNWLHEAIYFFNAREYKAAATAALIGLLAHAGREDGPPADDTWDEDDRAVLPSGDELGQKMAIAEEFMKGMAEPVPGTEHYRTVYGDVPVDVD